MNRHGYETRQNRIGKPFRGTRAEGMLDRMRIEEQVSPQTVNAGFRLAKGAVGAARGCGAEASGLAASDVRHGSRHA